MSEWAWRERGGEESHGPFPSREAAIADAKKADWVTHAHVGKVLRPLPENHVNVSMDCLIDHVYEAYHDNYAWDGYLDLTEDTETAERELHEALRAWARKHLVSVGWCVEEETEEVCLRGR